MSRSVARICRLLIVSALAGLVAVPTAVAGNPCGGHGLELPTSTTGTNTQIKLAPCAFAPTVAHVPAGSVVTFFNGPSFTHLITGANQEWGSPDVELEPGRTVAYRFDEPGIYPYACALHPGMSGAIVVGDLAAALAADTSTAGATPLSGAAGGADTAGAAPPRTGRPADPTTPNSTLAGLALVGSVAGAAGAVIGAAVAWFGARRRRRNGEAPAEPR